jgi:hypothetical protein
MNMSIIISVAGQSAALFFDVWEMSPVSFDVRKHVFINA